MANRPSVGTGATATATRGRGRGSIFAALVAAALVAAARVFGSVCRGGVRGGFGVFGAGSAQHFGDDLGPVEVVEGAVEGGDIDVGADLG
jgi:hypothetical protein